MVVVLLLTKRVGVLFFVGTSHFYEFCFPIDFIFDKKPNFFQNKKKELAMFYIYYKFLIWRHFAGVYALLSLESLTFSFCRSALGFSSNLKNIRGCFIRILRCEICARSLYIFDTNDLKASSSHYSRCHLLYTPVRWTSHSTSRLF